MNNRMMTLMVALRVGRYEDSDSDYDGDGIVIDIQAVVTQRL